MRGTRSKALPVFVVALAAVVTACGGDRIQKVVPVLVPPIEEIDFGAIPVLNQGTQELSLINTGRAALTVVSVRVDDPPEGKTSVFRVIEPPDAVPSGDEVKVTLAFSPEAEAAYEETLTVLTDDLEIPEVKVKLVGVGATRAVMVVEPKELDFGRVVEDGFAIQTLAITSQGTADLILEELAFAAGTSPAFTFFGSSKAPVTVKTVGNNGLPQTLTLSIKYAVAPGAPADHEGAVRIVSTDPDQREVLIPIRGTVNRAPLAQIADLGVGSPGMEISLDGRGSTDPDGDLPLTYAWTLRRKPLNSTTTITDPAADLTTMTLDPNVPGEYEVELNVTDAAGGRNLTSARAVIVAQAAEKLRVELFWENSNTDIDLHFLDSRITELFSAGDCHYANRTPDWGVFGDRTDDPKLTRDALVGYGPEVVGWVNPVDGVYRIAAYFQNDHETPEPASAVRVRVYLFGVLTREYRRTLQKEGDVWYVADVSWPSGTVTAVPE